MASRAISVSNQTTKIINAVQPESSENRFPEWVLKLAKLLVEVGPELIELLCIVLA
jgi:hypothetical protein